METTLNLQSLRMNAPSYLLRKQRKVISLKKQPRDDPEYRLHKSICDYIRFQFPKIMFNSGMEGLNLSKTARGKAKMLRSERGFPDLTIFEVKHGYGSLHLEIKTESPFKKNGELKASEHLLEQQIVIDKLRNRGYRAEFVWSLDQAMEIIKSYLT